MDGSTLEFIGSTVEHAITVSWLSYSVPISILLSFLILRGFDSIFWAFLAIAVELAVQAAWPLVSGPVMGAQSEIIAAVMKAFENPDLPVIGVQFFSFTFMIAIFYWTRRDFFR
jgi:hypothetical protein